MGEGTLNAFSATVAGRHPRAARHLHRAGPRARSSCCSSAWSGTSTPTAARSTWRPSRPSRWPAGTSAARPPASPVHELLGGRIRERVRVYANGWYRTERTPGGVRRRAPGRSSASGYTALKFDPFGAGWRVQDRREEDLSIDIVAAVREAVGAGCRPHDRGPLPLQRRDRAAHRRPPRGAPPGLARGAGARTIHLGSMVEVARRSPVPDRDRRELHLAAASSPTCCRTTRSTSCSPSRCTWVACGARSQLAAMADAHYAVVAPHSAQGPICSAISVQLGASVPNFYIQESFDEFNAPWSREIVGPPRAAGRTATSRSRPGRAWASTSTGTGSSTPYERAALDPPVQSGWERRGEDRSDVPHR